MELSFDTSTVIARISENREKHQGTYRAARAGYQEKLIEATAAVSIAAVQYEQGVGSHHSYQEAFNTLRNLSKPTHYLPEYDRAISMLKDTTDETITLDEQDYKQLMLDQWQWAQAFKSISASYMS